ncbi:MAG: RluA family pseudouridine synthase [Alphaproteobacteria bacterium]|nr:RluA family pseudouridine synthase [Alphaproteobacteria bacterium]
MSQARTETRRLTVSEADSGQRLDKLLAARWPDLSRARLQALIKAGQVSGGGRTLSEASMRVKPGLAVAVELPPAAPARPEAQAIPLSVLYEDADLIVIDKPAGLVVHPAPGNPDRTLVNALLAHCGPSLAGIGGERRPGIVHRLDKDTSGVMVIAKTQAAHADLARQFAAHSVERSYRALVWGVPSPARGRIEGAIGRDPRNRKRMAVVGRGGKPAVTHYRLLAARPPALALIECRLETGRTHQIRVHLAAKGHPLVGDPLYGRARKSLLKTLAPAESEAITEFPHQALHAGLLGFRHPKTRREMRFNSMINNRLTTLLENLHLAHTE